MSPAEIIIEKLCKYEEWRDQQDLGLGDMNEVRSAREAARRELLIAILANAKEEQCTTS